MSRLEDLTVGSSVSGLVNNQSVQIHMNFPYTDKNRNFWYQLGIDMKAKLAALKPGQCEHIYLVSLEDDEDGKQ